MHDTKCTQSMAIFAEDEMVPVAVLNVLWVSIDPEEHKPLSAIHIRQWTSQLLSRSILLGSSSNLLDVGPSHLNTQLRQSQSTEASGLWRVDPLKCPASC